MAGSGLGNGMIPTYVRVPYRRNAFRNSYFTYRLAILSAGQINKVAEEGGTSVKMLKEHYLSRTPVSQQQAEEWFSL